MEKVSAAGGGSPLPPSPQRPFHVFWRRVKTLWGPPPGLDKKSQTSPWTLILYLLPQATERRGAQGGGGGSGKGVAHAVLAEATGTSRPGLPTCAPPAWCPCAPSSLGLEGRATEVGAPLWQLTLGTVRDARPTLCILKVDQVETEPPPTSGCPLLTVSFDMFTENFTPNSMGSTCVALKESL